MNEIFLILSGGFLILALVGWYFYNKGYGFYGMEGGLVSPKKATPKSRQSLLAGIISNLAFGFAILIVLILMGLKGRL